MEQILITGLDGSGKSSVLSYLENFKSGNRFDIINLPVIDAESIRDDKLLYHTALFLNQMGNTADELKIPQLKAVALFGSMLVYQKILGYKAELGFKTIYCERHPAVDTGVYAQFYAQMMKPGLSGNAIYSGINKKFGKELEYLAGLIPVNINVTHEASVDYLADSIYRNFYLEKRTSVADLAAFFQVELPCKIYFLKASPEVLFKRIANRKILEAHESVETFAILGNAYKNLLNEIVLHQKIELEVIDAENAQSMEDFKIKITQPYC